MGTEEEAFWALRVVKPAMANGHGRGADSEGADVELATRAETKFGRLVHNLYKGISVM